MNFSDGVSTVLRILFWHQRPSTGSLGTYIKAHSLQQKMGRKEKEEQARLEAEQEEIRRVKIVHVIRIRSKNVQLLLAIGVIDEDAGILGGVVAARGSSLDGESCKG